MTKMTKRYLLLAAAVLMTAVAALAQAKASFPVRIHDFGYIQEAKGAVSHTFEFTNTGNKPLIIGQVRASCGCTKPEFPTKPIKPGKKGKIKVTFSPIGRPGAFEKQITVSTNGSEKRTVLLITGTVVPDRKKKK